MSDDEMSIFDSSTMDDDDSLFDDQDTLDKQRASLQTYIDSVPYECETIEEMQEKLEEIVGKIIICAQTNNWKFLTNWDGMLQCWLLMKYPMPRSTRSKLAKLYYELCLVPGLEPRYIRSWADMFSRLLSSKQGNKRKLETTDLELDWKPLWRVLQKELWPKKRLQDHSRNMVNIFLYVAEQSSRYYPAKGLDEMLSTFLPMLTKDTILTMVPVITSFVPPTDTHKYLPPLFKLWEAFNSAVMDDRMIDLAGTLSEEHVAGKFGIDGVGGAEWKDIGIWTESEWGMLLGKGFASMNVTIGSNRNSGSTASHADAMADRNDRRVKKGINKSNGIAKLLVYSIAVDGPVRSSAISTPRSQNAHFDSQQNGYLEGSKAMDYLDKLITSLESFFHPSNYGQWSLTLANFVQRLAAEFAKRWKEEEQSSCRTPKARRLTPAIRKAFVKILRTPALLAMFAKDPVPMAFAQATLRTMALMEPSLIMPELLERAYGGLEVVNETHRTTAVMTMLSAVPYPLVHEKLWVGGQKHLLPLLELCVPGIDLNDPIKTICATMFIVAAIQHVKIGDLSSQRSASSGADESMDAGEDNDASSDAGNPNFPIFSKEEERSMVRDSTASFADWVTSLFRRILALYENLPEEGGKRGTTGGKQEESVLKSIKSMMNIICLHLSDELFDLVLNLVYNYATTNAKSNAVRAFGQLVASLAMVKPKETIAKFLPYCISQIQEELKHGASSIRTTSTHMAVPSDTTLHWNISILRGCLGFGGATLLKYKNQILELLSLLVDKTKSQRGYTGTGRLITRVVSTLADVYPLGSRFVNTAEWEDQAFNCDHNLHWGRLYEAQDVDIEWHMPSVDEVTFVLEILDKIAGPALDKVELLLASPRWDNVGRNDFCRYLHACKSVWSGLPTLYEEQNKEDVEPCIDDEYEVAGLFASSLKVKAGFTLTDPDDPRYQTASSHRNRYGEVIHRAATVLRKSAEGEDHIDAVIATSKAIDVFLLEYALTRGTFDGFQKSYGQARDLNRVWSRQKENSRLVFVKRAHLYHSGRVYMHALYRRRSALDNQLINDVVELSLSPYTRVRRHAQAIFQNVCSSYVRSTRLALPALLGALAKGTDPDRMKGALYVLWNRGIMAYALSDQVYHGRFLLALLESQHEEKPSIQKLVGDLASDCQPQLTEEAVHTDAFMQEISNIKDAALDVQTEFTSSLVDRKILDEALQKASTRAAKSQQGHKATISSILTVAQKPATHWRYVQMATRFLYGLLRRDIVPSPEVAKFFMDHTISPQPTIRWSAQTAVVKLATFIKYRTYAKNEEELWLEQWTSPLQTQIPVTSKLIESLQRPVEDNERGPFIDKVPTGFVVWSSSLKAYTPADQTASPFVWQKQCQPTLKAIGNVLGTEYYSKLSALWSQESNKEKKSTELRPENAAFIKTIAKMFEGEKLDELLNVIDLLVRDTDKFKQRAAAEFLVGLLRGSKHWPNHLSEKIWNWMTSRLPQIFGQIKPDTIGFWETVFGDVLEDRDPRRNKPLIKWILSLPLEFQGDSAFTMTKSLTFFGVLVDALGVRMNSESDKYVDLLLSNANTGYAEIRNHIARNLYSLVSNKWQPTYPTTNDFLKACQISPDPLQIRDAFYARPFQDILNRLPKWKEERFPSPRVSQSEYDKVGLTLLQWLWVSCHGPQASLIFPYLIPMLPDIFGMSELNDSPELQTYSSAVLYVLSAITPAPEFVGDILQNFVKAIKSSKSWRIRLSAVPALVVFFYRNLMVIKPDGVSMVMDVFLDCLSDENVEVREMGSKALSGAIRCSQRQSILSLKNRFVNLARKTKIPPRTDITYAESLRSLHSAVLGMSALIGCFPYSVEPWMPPLIDVLATHATDPPPISTTIRECASEFKKTHQDTWHTDQQAFDEDQLQSLSTMLVGTSYYA